MFRMTIADDHPVVLAGLRTLLATRADWSIVAEARDGTQAVSQAVAHSPDVALVDYSLPLANGIEVTHQIKLGAPKVQILVLMMQTSEQIFREALRAGAQGCILKSDTSYQLFRALDGAMRRRSGCFDASPDWKSVPSVLSRQERRIAQLICDGHTNKSIGRLLDISYKTVETHRLNINHKLNLTSTAALVRYAIRNGLIEP